MRDHRGGTPARRQPRGRRAARRARSADPARVGRGRCVSDGRDCRGGGRQECRWRCQEPTLHRGAGRRSGMGTGGAWFLARVAASLHNCIERFAERRHHRFREVLLAGAQAPSLQAPKFPQQQRRLVVAEAAPLRHRPNSKREDSLRRGEPTTVRTSAASAARWPRRLAPTFDRGQAGQIPACATKSS